MSFREKNNTLLKLQAKNVDPLFQFDLLFSLIKDVHRSHKLKSVSRKTSTHNLTEIQQKSDYHLKILSNTTQQNSSSFKEIESNSSASKFNYYIRILISNKF